MVQNPSSCRSSGGGGGTCRRPRCSFSLHPQSASQRHRYSLAWRKAEAERIRSEAQREAESARAELLLSRQDGDSQAPRRLDREIQRRREEWDRLERRAEERARAQERKLEEIDVRASGERRTARRR